MQGSILVAAIAASSVVCARALVLEGDLEPHSEQAHGVRWRRHHRQHGHHESPQAVEPSHHSELGRRARVALGRHEARSLYTVPAVEPCGKKSAVCGPESPDNGRFPPTLVSLNASDVTKYQDHICNHDDGEPVAQRDITVAVTKVSGGQTCVFNPSSKLNYGMYREVWNGSHTMLLGDFAEGGGISFLSGPQRRLTMGNKRAKMDINESLLIVPYAHFHTIYAHSIMDFLPGAYVMFDYVRKHDVKIAVGSNLQKRLLLAAGLEKKHIFSSTMVSEDQVMCVTENHSIHVMEINRKGSNDYYFHRMLGYRGPGHSLAADMVATADAKTSSKSDRRPAVVFLGRCGAAARGMENEDAAYELVKEIMQRKGRTEELVRFCGDAGKPELQAAVMSRATTVVGPHGGAMSNLLYVKPGCSTHVVEFVQSSPFIPPGVNQAPQNRYKSFYYYGMGDSFDYKLVLLDTSEETGKLKVRMNDLEEALNRIW